MNNLLAFCIASDNDIKRRQAADDLEELQVKIDDVIEYIRLNFCNREDLDDCWHSAMQDILDILQK